MDNHENRGEEDFGIILWALSRYCGGHVGFFVVLCSIERNRHRFCSRAKIWKVEPADPGPATFKCSL